MKNLNIAEIYDLYLSHPRICTDTRNIIPDSLFVCLKGANFDGNRFAAAALEQGAAYVVTEDGSLSAEPHCIVVDDALDTLQQLGAYHRKRLTIPVIGITGTNGKTTTKELTAAVLSQRYRTAFTQGNLNNHIGVPLTLLAIKPGDEIAIVEMGANHPGEIAALCRIARPGFGLITNIGMAHIEGFGSVEEIVHTKKALYESVIADGGTLFVNKNDATLCAGLHYSKTDYYAENASNRITDMSPYLSVTIGGTPVSTRLTGGYNLDNILAAAAVGRHFGVPPAETARAINQYTPANHRSQVIRHKGNTIIADYYNANPTSMEAALRNLAAIRHPRKLAILGDMRELGTISGEEHRRIIELCRQLDIPAVFVGPEFCGQHPCRCYADVENLNLALAGQPVNDTMILVKGSNAMHLDRLTAILP